MHSHSSSEALIGILRSTSFLLKHYGYDGHDPSLTDLERSIGSAIRQLQLVQSGAHGLAQGVHHLDLQ
jgi:hypothetical protein